jgi:hypothetical protein
MTTKQWLRQAHRWLSIAFTAVSAAIFVALGAGVQPSRWAYSLPLLPLALLVATGLYLFALPYTARGRGSRRTA